MGNLWIIYGHMVDIPSGNQTQWVDDLHGNILTGNQPDFPMISMAVCCNVSLKPTNWQLFVWMILIIGWFIWELLTYSFDTYDIIIIVMITIVIIHFTQVFHSVMIDVYMIMIWLWLHRLFDDSDYTLFWGDMYGCVHGINLVGGWAYPSEQYESYSVGMDWNSNWMEKWNLCSKPPTSYDKGW